MTRIMHHKVLQKFILISVPIFVLFLVLEKINGRFWLNDFKVMYMAAEAMLHGDQIYGIPFGLGSGYYKYSPVTLLFFVPYTLVPFEVASVIHFFISAGVVLTSVILIQKLISEHVLFLNNMRLSLLFIAMLCIMVHVVRELHLGNVNMMLVLLICLSIHFSITARYTIAGVLLAIVFLTKPYFAICMVPVVLYQKRNLAFSVLASLLGLIVVSILFLGVTKGITVYGEWYVAMMQHSDYLYSNHTIFSLLTHYTGVSFSEAYGIPMLGAISVLLGTYFWLKDKGKDGNRSFIVLVFLMIAFIPSFLITDTEHFLFSLPLISMLLLYLSKERNYGLMIPFIVMVLMYGGNINDLWGKSLSTNIEEAGILGIGNLLIIGTVVYLYATEKIGPKRIEE